MVSGFAPASQSEGAGAAVVALTIESEILSAVKPSVADVLQKVRDMGTHKQTSNKLTYEDAVEIHLMIMDGWIQSRIAAHFGTNQGRVSEVNTGQLFPGSYEEACRRRSEAAE